MGMMINRRRVCGGKSLPYDAEVEYLENSGTQFIDTGYIPTGYDNIIETKITYLGYSTGNSWLAWFATYVNEETNTYRIIRNSNTDTSIFIYNGNRASMASAMVNVTIGSDYDFKLYTTYFLINGIRYTANEVRGTENSDTLKLFNINSAKIRMWRFKLTKGTTVMLDLIPVRIGTTGYMYDKVSKQLFGNSGTGSFILGPDV